MRWVIISVILSSLGHSSSFSQATKLEKALQHTDFAQNVDQQRHLVFRSRPNPAWIHQSENNRDVVRNGLPICPSLVCIPSFSLNKAELKQLFTFKPVTIRFESPLFSQQTLNWCCSVYLPVAAATCFHIWGTGTRTLQHSCLCIILSTFSHLIVG